jgi:THUMP domain-like/RNA cap guanine-N2 methyltransferase
LTTQSPEHWLLETEPGAHLLTEIASVTSILPAHLDRWRKLAPPRIVSAAIDLTRARVKAPAKFALGARMWVNTLGLEQATSESVARHKAARFPTGVVVDLCAGIGGDSLAIAQHAPVISVDLDFAMCHRIRANAALYGLDDRILPVRARAEAFSIPPHSWVHIDPDRRYHRTSRARRLEDYAPNPDFWKTLIANQPGGAIKVGPASDFQALFDTEPVEIELVSLRGECKEATAWFGAAVTCRRRATRLPENVTWTDRDGDPLAYAPSVPLGAFIFDPDPALIRAGLLDGYATAHNLYRVADGIDYLTADEAIPSPWLSAFEVKEVSPLDIKHLRRMLVRHDIGSLDIKVRGVELTPESLRPQLKLKGSATGTLLIVGGPTPARAILAARNPH